MHIFDGDAVGNDIVGMAKVLTNLGIKQSWIGGKYFRIISKVQNLNSGSSYNFDLNQFEILIYHHSTFGQRRKIII